MAAKRQRRVVFLAVVGLLAGLCVATPAAAFPPTPSDPPEVIGAQTDFEEAPGCFDVVMTVDGVVWCSTNGPAPVYGARLFRFSAGGTLLGTVGIPASAFNLATDGDGNLFALMSRLGGSPWGWDVRVYSSSGELTDSWNIPESFLGSTDVVDIAADHQGRVFLLTQEDDGLTPPQRRDEVLVYEADGTFADRWFVQPSVAAPVYWSAGRGLTADPDGGVYVDWVWEERDEFGEPFAYYNLAKRTADGSSVWEFNSVSGTTSTSPLGTTFAPGAGLWVEADGGAVALLDPATGESTAVTLGGLGGPVSASADGRVLFENLGSTGPSGDEAQIRRWGDPTTLSVSQTASATEVHALQTIEYEVTVENTGADVATHVWVDGGDAPDCDHGPVPAVPAGGEVTFSCAYVTAEDDQPAFENTVTVDSAQTSTVESNGIDVEVLPPEIEDPPPFLDEVGEFGTGPGEFRYPAGAAVDPDGRVFVADSDNGRVHVFDDAGGLVDEWGEPGSDPGELSEPAGVALDVGGRVYVTDIGRDRVVVFEADGTFVHEWGGPGNDEGEFDGPVAIAISADDEVFVADEHNHRVQVFETDGSFVREIGEPGTGDGELDRPAGVAVGPDGDVFVTDGPVVEDDIGPDAAGAEIAPASAAQQPRVQRFAPTGEFVASWGVPGSGAGQFSVVTGVAVDHSGRVYVADRFNHRIQVFDADGTFVTRWGQDGTEPGDFDEPVGVAVGPHGPGREGDVYVVDSANHRVQRFGFRPGIEGRVTEAGTGEPVDGAFVAVLRASDFAVVAGAVADDEGEYAIDMGPGEYHLYLIDPGGRQRPGFHGAPDLVEVDGRPVDVDPAMAAGRGEIAGSVAVEDQEGVPVGGSWVVTLDAATGRPALGTIADEGGHYRFEDQAPGSRLLAYLDPSLAHRPEFFDDVPVPDGATPVVVTPGTTSVVDTDLRPRVPPGGGALIEGTVTETQTGDPLGGVWVVALRAATFEPAGTAVTDSAGGYELDVEPGDYKLEFFDPSGGHGMEWHEDLPFTGLAGATAVTAPATVDADLDDALGGVDGTVTSAATAQPIAAAWVVVIGADGPVAGAVTGDDGTYEVADLPAGSYVVTFAAPGSAHRQEYWDDAATFGGAEPLAVTGGATTTADAALDVTG